MRTQETQPLSSGSSASSGSWPSCASCPSGRPQKLNRLPLHWYPPSWRRHRSCSRGRRRCHDRPLRNPWQHRPQRLRSLRRSRRLAIFQDKWVGSECLCRCRRIGQRLWLGTGPGTPNCETRLRLRLASQKLGVRSRLRLRPSKLGVSPDCDANFALLDAGIDPLQAITYCDDARKLRVLLTASCNLNVFPSLSFSA